MSNSISTICIKRQVENIWMLGKGVANNVICGFGTLVLYEDFRMVSSEDCI